MLCLLGWFEIFEFCWICLINIIVLDIKLGTMSNVKVSILCWFKSKLTIDEKNKSIYLDGTVKSISVRKEITYLELVEKIHQLSKINQNDYQIKFDKREQKFYVSIFANPNKNVSYIRTTLHPTQNQNVSYIRKRRCSMYNVTCKILLLDRDKLQIQVTSCITTALLYARLIESIVTCTILVLIVKRFRM